MDEPHDKYHEGELTAQRAAHEELAAHQNAAVISDTLSPGAIRFLQAQPMLVTATRDRDHRLWSSLLFGPPGFASATDDGQSLTIQRPPGHSNPTDLLWSDLAPGASLGLLAIDLATRRRLRINGQVTDLSGTHLGLHVDQAYPNCPKYIQRRLPGPVTARPLPAPDFSQGQTPDAPLLAAIARADTCFVASGHPSRGLDASHRGGPPGFIQTLAPDLLRIPDYAGNGMFNTLGNLLIDPHCGLTILDFQNNRLHQLTGHATPHLHTPEPPDDSPLTGRFWDVSIHAWRSSDLPIHANWQFVDYSPYNPS